MTYIEKSTVSKLGSATEKIWFGLLSIYIITNYLAQDVLLPSIVNSVILYIFLAYSAVAIVGLGKIRLTSIFRWEVLCLVVAFLAMIYSPEFSIFGETYYSLIVNFVIVFIFTQMSWTKERLYMIFKVYVLSSVVLIIWLALTDNLKDESASGRLGQELTGNANIFAIMLMVSALCAFWLIVALKSKMTKFCMLLSLVVIYIGMFLSGGRKYVVIPIIFIYILLTFKADRKGNRHIFKSAFVAIAAVLTLYFLITKVPFIYDSIGYRFDGFFALFDDSKVVDGSTRVRMEMIEYGFKWWLKSPIWGYGFDSFKYYNLTNFTAHFYYSHNNFIELLFNQGIIGFFVYYGFYIYLFYEAVKIRKDSPYKGFVLSSIIAWLFFEYFGITYSTTPMHIMLFFCMLCLDFAKKENELEESDEEIESVIR